MVLGIFCIIVELTKIYDQGGAFALLQRLPSVSAEQIVLPDVGHCSLDTSHTSTTAHISEVGKISKGTSSQVDDTGGFRQEGMRS